jgi:general nucleoside transport system permease protein
MNLAFAQLLGAFDSSAVNLSLLLGQAVRLGVLIAFVALGEMVCQRAGVLNIGVEGVFLAAACAAAASSYLGWGVWTGFVVAPFIGMLTMSLIAFLVLVLRADQIVTGFGINLAALGITTVIVKSTPDLNFVDALKKVKPFGDSGVMADVFNHKASVYLIIPAALVCWFLLFRTAWGLRVKAVGETPAAADAAGLVVNRIRWQAMLVGGALVGLGGAALALGQGSGFTENMVSGRGFIALVAVIFGRWRPGLVVAGCLFFGLFEAVTLQAPAWGLDVPSQLLNMVPYLSCLVALAVFRKGTTPPSAITKPFERKR